jgi:adenosylhomocysteine nucleosidase
VPKYHTPYEYLPDLSTNFGDVVCGTGDSFVTNKDELVKDMHIVDMEAYAIAKICKKMLVPFMCFKYISDNADQKSGSEWQNFSMKKGEESFIQEMKKRGIEI